MGRGEAYGARGTVLVLAGPNGAGKTTTSSRIVPEGSVFLNADQIAKELAAGGHGPKGRDIAAGRAVLSEMHRLEERGMSFCLETNLAGRGLVRSIARWEANGYRVRLAFVALLSPDLAIARVAERVAAGGHDVPEPVVRRRWREGLRSLYGTYTALVDEWTLTDNSGVEPLLVATGGRGQSDPVISDAVLWEDYRPLASIEP